MSTCITYIYAHQEINLPLAIPFDGGVLTLQYSWCFVITFFNGALLISLGVLILTLNLACPDKLYEMLGLEQIQDEALAQVYSKKLVNERDLPSHELHQKAICDDFRNVSRQGSDAGSITEGNFEGPSCGLRTKDSSSTDLQSFHCIELVAPMHCVNKATANLHSAVTRRDTETSMIFDSDCVITCPVTNVSTDKFCTPIVKPTRLNLSTCLQPLQSISPDRLSPRFPSSTNLESGDSQPGTV